MSQQQQILNLDIGIFGVYGTTAVIHRFITGIFLDVYFPVPDETFTKVISVDDQLVNIKIIEFSEGDDFRELRYSYFQHVQGYILCYDVNNDMTLDNIKEMYNDIMEIRECPFPCVICGLNADLRDDPKDYHVPLSEVEQIGEELGCEFIEVSAKTGKNIDELFEKIARKFVIKDDKKSDKKVPVSKTKKKGNWEIGLLSETQSDALNIAKNYVFGEFGDKMSNDELIKIIEVNSKTVFLSFSIERLIVSNYFYEFVDGIVFVIVIDQYENIQMLKKSIQNAKTVFKDLSYVIAADYCKLSKNDVEEASFYEKFKALENELDTKVFFVSWVTGENIEEMFFYLTNQISKKKKVKKIRKIHTKNKAKKNKK